MSQPGSGPQPNEDRKRAMTQVVTHADQVVQPETESTRSAGAFWRHGAVTRQQSDDATRFKLTIRDALALLLGSLAMFGAQLGAQYGLRSDIRDLNTAFQNYQRQQTETNGVLQRQIDEWRQETKLHSVYIAETKDKLSELKGILIGAGVKGLPK